MFYVLTDDQGSVVSFPYTLTDLKRDNPDTSFPKIINAELAASYNCFLVSPTPRPEIANPYE